MNLHLAVDGVSVDCTEALCHLSCCVTVAAYWLLPKHMASAVPFLQLAKLCVQLYKHVRKLFGLKAWWLSRVCDVQ